MVKTVEDFHEIRNKGTSYKDRTTLTYYSLNFCFNNYSNKRTDGAMFCITVKDLARPNHRLMMVLQVWLIYRETQIYGKNL